MILSQDQRGAVKAFLSHVNSPRKYLSIHGAAGTGKTTAAQAMLNAYIKRWPNNKIAVAAFTNQAVKNIKKKVKIPRGKADNFSFSTLHSLAGMEARHTSTNDIEFIESDRESDLGDVDLLFIDEASFIPRSIAEQLHRHVASRLMTKIVLIGDKFQIGPVNDKYDSAVYYIPEIAEKLCVTEYELSLVMRQAGGSPILKFVTSLRDQVYQPFTETTSAGSIVTASDFMDRAVQGAIENDYIANPDAVCFVAWRNAVIDEYNMKVRAAKFGLNSMNRINVGDVIVATGNIRSSVYKPNRKPLLVDTMSTNDVAVVYEIDTKKRGGDIRTQKIADGISITYRLCRAMCDGKRVKLKIPTYEGQAKLKQWRDSEVDRIIEARESGIKPSQEAAMWETFYQTLALFQDSFKPAFGGTAHKQQGRTVKTAYVDTRDTLNGMQFRKPIDKLHAYRLTYTACTRPSHELVIPEW